MQLHSLDRIDVVIPHRPRDGRGASGGALNLPVDAEESLLGRGLDLRRADCRPRDEREPEKAGCEAKIDDVVCHRFQNPCDGMRNARLKRDDAFSHAMIIVSSAIVSSS